MLAQLITGPAEEEKQTDQAIRAILEESGYSVSLVAADEAIQARSREALALQLSGEADVTVANSGIRWANVTRLVSPDLLPNSIVITSNTGMQHGWEIKPVILLGREPNLASNLRHAAHSLKGGVRLPVRNGSYVRTSYGLIIPDQAGHAQADVWQSFASTINPGFRFSSRVRQDGTSAQFTITKVLDEMVVFKVDVTDQVVAVTREELYEHYEAWVKEKHGQPAGGVLINDYVMGILDWMDDARLLA